MKILKNSGNENGPLTAQVVGSKVLGSLVVLGGMAFKVSTPPPP